MLYDKCRLVKFLSNQNIQFIFDIFELFYQIIKNMEECQLKKIQQLTVDNILEEEKLMKKKTNSEKIIIK